MLDIRLGRASGVDLLSHLRTQRPDLICVMMTAHADTQTAIAAMRQAEASIAVLPAAERRALESSMRAPGRTCSVTTLTSATGTGPKKSNVMRATRASSRG